MKKNGVESRKPGQTIEEYTCSAAEQLGKVEGHLAWFTEATWAAAYDPRWVPAGTSTQMVQEARAHLSSLEAALA